jgi:hypothetical protein
MPSIAAFSIQSWLATSDFCLYGPLVDGSELQNAIHQQLQRKDSKCYLAGILFKVKKTVDKYDDYIEKQIRLHQLYSNILWYVHASNL